MGFGFAGVVKSLQSANKAIPQTLGFDLQKNKHL